ncbi:MAG: hypothetical protein WCS84_17170, partial [Nocardioides sp.]
ADRPQLESSFSRVSPVALRVVLATDREPPPDSQVLQQFDNLDCDAPPVPVGINKPMAACDDAGVKYSLEPARILGYVDSASAGIPSGSANWVVTLNLDLDDDASRTLADLTADLAVSHVRLAVVLRGRVLTAPEVEAPIRGGEFQITGNFSEEEAQALADRLAEG